ncbi:Sulfatase modifying factor 1 precursor (C-alpha-formyglycine- generating enzyme 1) [Tenacibaculum sp. 190524A02b]|uniref:formylglycine-generating enzyme family protein n=1 Tax=Tenacibaculum vairaonense TaxID=3137860 RepID=UPI0032B1F19A
MQINQTNSWKLIGYMLYCSLVFLSNISCKNPSEKQVKTPEGMIWIPSGTFTQGAVPHDRLALSRELPSFNVEMNGFFIDITEVTNKQFSKFIKETGYITVAERPVKWNELKKELPIGTPKPHDSLLQPGSLTFKKVAQPTVNRTNYHQWWKWTLNANWMHPQGPNSSIKGKENHPVIHIAYEDAIAYCKWANRRLPTEAEWEYAARGKNNSDIYFWGNDATVLAQKANTWNGNFPYSNTLDDGFERTAPVKQFPPNTNGLYDMAGNVWEWTSDWYYENRNRELASSKQTIKNPTFCFSSDNTSNGNQKVIKGGSFLCHASYCASYRISAKMNSDVNSSTEHIGFRTVATVAMLKNNQK